MVWNEDKNLTPIEYRLPSPPPYEEIEGFGLPPEEQYWKHKPLPPKLKKINDMTHDENRVELTPRMKMAMIEKDPEFYRDEIEYIRNEWERRERGHWFFNNGIPTMITGDHYFFLQWYPIDGEPPDFRNRDRRWFWFWYMVENDDACFGFNVPKQRRVGDTAKACSIRLNKASMYPYYKTGLQHKTEKDASDLHKQGLYDQLKYLPFFFMPMMANSQNTWTDIIFDSPRSKAHPDYGHEGLNSIITYKDAGPKAYDGTKQWLIHNDEPGKLDAELDINERVRIQMPCLTNIVRNSSRKGKMINTTTVGEMEGGGGKRFKLLCDASKYHERNENGMTNSGLYLLFQPAKEGMEHTEFKSGKSFYDKYGNADSEAIEKFLIARREALRKAGRMADYIEECRQYPLEYNDCWKTSARQSIFNQIKMEERLDYYRHGNPDKIRGNFEWGNGPDSKVVFIPSDIGRWYVSFQFNDPKMSNRQFIDENGVKFPLNKNKFIAGGDPFKFSKVKDKNRASLGGGAVFMNHDIKTDYPGKPEAEWETHRFVATYWHRPPTVEDYGEDMIKMCVYYGCEMFPEVNVDFLHKYFVERGYGGYLYYKFDPRKGYSDMPGQYTHVKETNNIFSVIQTYIEKHVHRERHDELITQWKELVDDLTDYDLAVASGLALIGAQSVFFDHDEDSSGVDILSYIPRYSYPEN